MLKIKIIINTFLTIMGGDSLKGLFNQQVDVWIAVLFQKILSNLI